MLGIISFSYFVDNEHWSRRYLFLQKEIELIQILLQTLGIYFESSFAKNR